jgi:hypothetical protein
MLVVVQHPLLDVRSLLDEETYRVRAPTWPRPIRVFGRRSRESSRNDKIAALRDLSSQVESKGLSRKIEAAASLIESCSGMHIEKAEVIMGDSIKAEIRAGKVAGVGIGSARVETGGIARRSAPKRGKRTAR